MSAAKFNNNSICVARRHLEARWFFSVEIAKRVYACERGGNETLYFRGPLTEKELVIALTTRLTILIVAIQGQVAMCGRVFESTNFSQLIDEKESSFFRLGRYISIR